MHSLAIRLGVPARSSLGSKLSGFQAGRLRILVQLLAHSSALIAGLRPNRSHYHLGLADASAGITFRVRDARHRFQVLKALDRE
jgi:hypothetical protein